MNKFIPILFLTCFTYQLQAQVFWSEDFSNGIPSDWSNEDSSEFDFKWTYCPDTTSYGSFSDQAPSCPLNFTDINNRQFHFKSESPENGFASFITPWPFLDDLLNKPFDTQLTTDAINCLDKSEVYITFNTHFGIFSPNQKATFNVSTDGINWISYDPFPNLINSNTTVPGSERWSLNPKPVIFDISTVAANQETVFLQWHWRGYDEYHWSIDDVKLTTVDPTPDFDITLSPTSKFHAIMTNFKTPVSQIDTAYFLTDVANAGSAEASNLEVIALVMDAAETVTLYEEKILIPQLAPNQSIEALTFPPYYHQDGPGEYKIVYTIGNQASDAVPGNSYFEYPFFITEDTFSKNEETQQTVNLFPIDLDQDDKVENNWGIANSFYIPNGVGYFVDELIFELPLRFEANIQGETYFINESEFDIDVKLFTWDNDNDDNLAEPSETTLIGFAVFKVTGGNGNQLNRLKLVNTSGDNSRIPLEDNQHYFLALEYNSTASNNILFSVKASTRLNYDPMIEANKINNKLRYASLAKVGNTSDYNIFTFEGNVIPHIGFTITDEAGVSTTTLLDERAVEIYPNPADKKVNIKLDIPFEQNAKLEILSINGSFIRNIPLLSGNTEAIFDCTHFENGTYLLAYKSAKSRLYKKFVVIH